MPTVDLAAQGVPARTIRIIRTEPEASGKRGDRSWTRYRVYAEELDGTPITEVLKTFDALPVGEVKVTQEAYVGKDGKVQSYTVKSTTPRRANGEERKSATPLERRVAQLESEVADLRAKFDAAIRSALED
jgi:hypothetical protein